MAQLLKRQYDIVVLKTELIDARRDEPDVRFTLQCKLEGSLENIREWRGHTSAMGLRERFDPRQLSSSAPPPISLPGDLLDDLKAWFTQETEGDRPLWVHLVKPYGALRFVPWERLLGETLEVPILMLPDFIFPPPRAAAAVLDVVLCGSAPLGHEEGSVYHAVSVAARRILEGTPRRTRLHVFVDKQFVEFLKNEWNSVGRLGNEILVYDHTIVAKYVEEDPSSRLVDSAGVLRSPWLLWMREALRGRGVDVVHFCCHGYLSRDRGALLFAQSPIERSERYLAGPVGTTELQTFLTQTGAWSSVFTSLPDNFSEPGLRALADQIAQSRPGPMMMHSLGRDPDGGALAAGYHFLFGTAAEPAPRSTALFIYCQPYLSADSAPARRSARGPVLMELARNALQQAQVQRADDHSPLDALFGGADNVSPWIASTERFAEQVQLRYQELARDELLPEHLHERQTQLALETVNRLRAAVAELSSPSEKGNAA